MVGPALLPATIPPPIRQKQNFLGWRSPALPIPKPARSLARRRGVHPFADIAAGFGDLISSISRGEHITRTVIAISSLYARSHACVCVAGPKYDIVLSSGFLAFASHSGFLKAVEEVKQRSLLAAKVLSR